jgi:hypothetical protein
MASNSKPLSYSLNLTSNLIITQLGDRSRHKVSIQAVENELEQLIIRWSERLQPTISVVSQKELGSSNVT